MYTHFWRSSGTGLFAQELVNGLLEIGARVTFVSPRSESAQFEQPRERLTRIRPNRERVDGAARPVRIVYSLGRIFGGMLGLIRARLATRAFIVSIPDPMLFFLPVLLLLRLSGARVIFVAHDPVPHAWQMPPRWRWLERLGHRLAYTLSRHVVVLSEASRRKFVEAFPKLAGSVAVIEHGVFVIGEPLPPARTGQLLVFGTIRRNKGIMEAMTGVIAAHAAGLPVRLVIAGDTHREDPLYTRECMDLAHAAPDIIDLRIGYVSNEDLPPLFAASDALLLPYTSFYSQSGVAILAASNGRPVIASSAGGIGELIAEGMPSVEIAEPVSADSVAAAIRTFFATSGDEWNARALRYRRAIMERRSWASISERYVALAKGP